MCTNWAINWPNFNWRDLLKWTIFNWRVTTYGNSAQFTLDYTPPSFTSASLANDAADGYINNTEKSVNSHMIKNYTFIDSERDAGNISLEVIDF